MKKAKIIDLCNYALTHGLTIEFNVDNHRLPYIFNFNIYPFINGLSNSRWLYKNATYCVDNNKKCIYIFTTTRCLGKPLFFACKEWNKYWRQLLSYEQ